MTFPVIRCAEWDALPLPTPDRLGTTEVLIQTVRTLVSAEIAGTNIAVYSGTSVALSERLPEHLGMLIHWGGADPTAARPHTQASPRPRDR